MKNLKKTVIEYISILASCSIIAFAITAILKPNNLISGGVTGASILLEKVVNINYTYIFYFLSIIVLISTYFTLGKKQAEKIAIYSILLPSTIVVFDKMNLKFVENDIFLSCIYFGILIGIGAGITLKTGYSQGGTDSIAKIIHKKYLPFVGISQIILSADISIILLSTLIFDLRTALYGILTQVVIAKTIDVILFGFGSRKVKIEIISKESEVISKFIINEVRRGISTYEIKGGYTRKSKVKITCICTPREATMIKTFISKTDVQSFVYLTPILTVWGEGLGFESLMEEN
ncbi:YitT family protein [Clostridium grantii]|uniref:Uncharacterized membrane-anchored protein YitT, contains DUF161 and DUF2179 domains n=1 Tax=Clostridium grantii DSM 8605 TaxID=1121316 RepID=A0A1M5QHH0_9CLOT|nr:YitT family protein [Clostridium grantii]SHH13229.1 Uncharacterized membrane-anchored protein YitT, contains DUF161 and DUF2179 domains [Clostridium grantii DSM 8605]